MAQAGADSPHAKLAEPNEGVFDTGPASSVRTVVERPPWGLARGMISSEPWAVTTLGTTLVVLGLGAVAWRAVAGWRASRSRRRQQTRRPPDQGYLSPPQTR